jgi:hypothetical protein
MEVLNASRKSSAAFLNLLLTIFVAAFGPGVRPVFESR